LILFLISSCAISPHTPTPDPWWIYPHGIISADGLTVNIALDETTYQMGQPISVTTTLMNMGDVPGWVNKRMRLVYDGADAATIEFVLKDSSGVELPFVSRLDFGPEKVPGDFVILSPGEFVGNTFEISASYPLGPGQHSIQVIYTNTLDLNNGEVAWKGRLESEVVNFAIEP
jgi:hypothetical protein